MNDWPTTRRYHRSLMSAFQIDGADAIEHYRRPSRHVADAVVAVLAVGVLLAILFGVL